MSQGKPKGSGEERRKFMRLNVGISTTYEVLPSGAPASSTAKNISASGVMLSVTRAHEPGTRLRVQVPLPGRETPVSFVGEGRWCREQSLEERKLPVPLLNIGVEFVEISETDVQAIAEFVEQQLKLRAPGPSVPGQGGKIGS